jgi:repressor LexA
MALTRRQKQVYDFLAHFIHNHGYSPSFEEIKQGMKLRSLATVHKHVTNLEKKGLLKRDYNRARSIDVLPPKAKMKQQLADVIASTTSLPLVGRIAAGRPVENFEQPETISLGDFTKARSDVFVLQVRGDSMMDEAILDNDYVLIEKTQVARNGEIVVALVEGAETTLKRIYKEGDNVRLQPSNAAMPPIIVPSASVNIQGRVIGVLRKY